MQKLYSVVLSCIAMVVSVFLITYVKSSDKSLGQNESLFLFAGLIVPIFLCFLGVMLKKHKYILIAGIVSTIFMSVLIFLSLLAIGFGSFL